METYKKLTYQLSIEVTLRNQLFQPNSNRALRIIELTSSPLSLPSYFKK